LFGLIGGILLGEALSFWPSPVSLAQMQIDAACGVEGREKAAAVLSFAAFKRWQAMFVLLVVSSLIGLCLSVEAFLGRNRPHGPDLWGIVAVAAAAVGYRLSHIPGQDGFLSEIARTLVGGVGCEGLWRQLWIPRRVGEAAAIVLGAATAATAVLPRLVDASVLAARLHRLHRLLYGASLLFVAGLLVSQAAFALVVSNWVFGTGDAEALAKTLPEVVTSGVLQAGVGYSAVLAVFFLPARAYLAWRAAGLAEASAPGASVKQRRAWLEERGLVGSAREAVGQVVALLAPVLSAPIVDALAKLG
jgi:hypothetical protein